MAEFQLTMRFKFHIYNFIKGHLHVVHCPLFSYFLHPLVIFFGSTMFMVLSKIPIISLHLMGVCCASMTAKNLSKCHESYLVPEPC